MTTPSASPSSPPPIDSRTAWVQALAWGFDTAMGAGARQIVCVDPDFVHWPLDDPRLHGALSTWLRLPQRRLVLLAAHFDEVPRRHPRFMGWRRDWSHALSTLVVVEELAAQLPQRLVDDADVCVQLFDSVHWRGRAGHDARTAHTLRLENDALLQQAAPGLPWNVLGL